MTQRKHVATARCAGFRTNWMVSGPCGGKKNPRSWQNCAIPAVIKHIAMNNHQKMPISLKLLMGT